MVFDTEKNAPFGSIPHVSPFSDTPKLCLAAHCHCLLWVSLDLHIDITHLSSRPADAGGVKLLCLNHPPWSSGKSCRIAYDATNLGYNILENIMKTIIIMFF